MPPSRRDLAAAHSFERRRLLAALTRGATPHGQSGVRSDRALVLGAAVAVLLVAGAAVVAMLWPRAGGGPEPPAPLPAADRMIETGWTACVDDRSGISVEIAVRPDVAETPLAAGFLAEVGQEQFLIATARRTGLAGQTFAFALPTDPAARHGVLAALGLPVGLPAREVPSDWLALFPPATETDLEVAGLDDLAPIATGPCAVLDSSADADPRVALRSASPARAPAMRAVEPGRVEIRVETGYGADYVTVSWDGAGGSERHLVDDEGRRRPLIGSAADRLGYAARRPTRIPMSWSRLLPEMTTPPPAVARGPSAHE